MTASKSWLLFDRWDVYFLDYICEVNEKCHFTKAQKVVREDVEMDSIWCFASHFSMIRVLEDFGTRRLYGIH